MFILKDGDFKIEKTQIYENEFVKMRFADIAKVEHVAYAKDFPEDEIKNNLNEFIAYGKKFECDVEKLNFMPYNINFAALLFNRDTSTDTKDAFFNTVTIIDTLRNLLEGKV